MTDEAYARLRAAYAAREQATAEKINAFDAFMEVSDQTAAREAIRAASAAFWGSTWTDVRAEEADVKQAAEALLLLNTSRTKELAALREVLRSAFYARGVFYVEDAAGFTADGSYSACQIQQTQVRITIEGMKYVVTRTLRLDRPWEIIRTESADEAVFLFGGALNIWKNRASAGTDAQRE